MQPAPSPAQSYYRQDNFPYMSGCPQGLSPARIPNTIPPSPSQPTAPRYDAQSHTGTFMDPTSVPPGAGHCNGPYAGSGCLTLPVGHGPNHTTANSLGTGSPPLYRGQYTMPSVLHASDYFGQGASADDAGHTFAAEQFPGHPINLTHFLPRAYTTPNNESASPVWRLFNCWVVYEEQNELHLTIVFKRIPLA